MNNTAKKAMGHLWGERTSLVHKAMVYAFSLDVRALSKGPYLTVKGVDRERAEETETYGVRHLFEETIVTMPEGLRCDVPTGCIDGGEGVIGDPTDPASCWLNLRLRSTLRGGHAMLNFATNGVVEFDGGPSAFRSAEATTLAGQAFLSSCQEASTGTYRWLDRRQLFGVGLVKGRRKRRKAKALMIATDEWVLDFSFDLYAAL
jgi:hypothetical protein